MKPSRKPSDIVAPNLRIREMLRQRLLRAAKTRGLSLNREMTRRLELSLEEDGMRSLETIAADLREVCKRMGAKVDA
jgi:hypothetical protein